MTSDYEARNISAMRYLIAGAMLMTIGCGGTPAQREAAATPDAATCTIDGQLADGCYAASKGGGAVFGIAMTRGTAGMPAFVAFYFQASTQVRDASTFPAPNNDMAYMMGNQTFAGTGTATWANNGSTFCVTTTAIAEATTATTHVGCVPSALLN